MKRLLTFILILTSSTSFSQDWAVKQQVITAKSNGVSFAEIPFFSFIGNNVLPQNGTYQQLKLDAAFRNSILKDLPAAIKLRIPLSNNKYIDCELVKFSLGNIKFTENNDEVIPHVKIPATYRGIVAGERAKNIVMLTVNEDYISLLATFHNRALQISKADEPDKLSYRLYDSRQLSFPSAKRDCGTANKNASISENGIDLSGILLSPDSVQDKCVNVFVDCFDSLYIWRGSNSQQTINYAYELFNAVATGYLNEQINVQISTINVWTTPDPFRGDTRENALADLAANYEDNFWGNICVGLDYSTAGNGRSGIAGDIGRAKAMAPAACKVYTAAKHQFCYNDLNYTGIATGVTNFPTGPNTTGAAVYLVMHEMGHLLGAHHTFWCGWKLTSNPDTYGAIDSCGGVEGTCALGPPPPLSGATMMSYCVGNWTPNDFVDFNNGFGPLPGNAMRNFVDQNTCIASCLACLGSVYRNIGGDLGHTAARPPGKRSNRAQEYNASPAGQKSYNVFFVPASQMPQKK